MGSFVSRAEMLKNKGKLGPVIVAGTNTKIESF